MNIFKQFFLVLFLLLNTDIFGQVLNFKLVMEDGEYVGDVDPAMNIVRTTIQEVTPGKEYRHRLMDFNNQNSFKDIKELLSRSIAKLEAILEEN